MFFRTFEFTSFVLLTGLFAVVEVSKKPNNVADDKTMSRLIAVDFEVYGKVQGKIFTNILKFYFLI